MKSIGFILAVLIIIVAGMLFVFSINEYKNGIPLRTLKKIPLINVCVRNGNITADQSKCCLGLEAKPIISSPEGNDCVTPYGIAQMYLCTNTCGNDKCEPYEHKCICSDDCK